MPCLKTFLQICQPRLVHFSNRFLHWNRGIKAVVLITIKGTNGVFLKSKDFSREPQKSPQKLKIAGKPDLIGEENFSFRHLWLLIEWNQVKYSRQLFFYFVPQCYMSWINQRAQQTNLIFSKNVIWFQKVIKIIKMTVVGSVQLGLEFILKFFRTKSQPPTSLKPKYKSRFTPTCPGIFV